MCNKIDTLEGSFETQVQLLYLEKAYLSPRGVSLIFKCQDQKNFPGTSAPRPPAFSTSSYQAVIQHSLVTPYLPLRSKSFLRPFPLDYTLLRPPQRCGTSYATVPGAALPPCQWPLMNTALISGMHRSTSSLRSVCDEFVFSLR